jgi:uncharacterized membrane protein
MCVIHHIAIARSRYATPTQKMEVAMTKTGYSRDVARRQSNTQARALAATYTARSGAAGLCRLVTAISNPDLVAVAVFCTIGLLATVNLLLRIPDIGLL